MCRLISVCLIGLSCAIYPILATAQEYSIVQIPTPPGFTNLQTSAINKSGQVTGNIDGYIFLYSQGVTQNLHFDPESSNGVGEGINDLGQIAGYGAFGAWVVAFFDTDDSDYPAASLPGLLGLSNGPPFSTNVYALSVNNAGQITGGADAADGYLHLFLYSSGVMNDLGVMPNGHFAKGMSINQSGEIAGVGDVGGDLHAFVFSGGQFHDIGRLPGGTQSAASATNDCGQITGTSDSRRSPGHAFLYSHGRMRDLGLLPHMTRSYGNAINNNGEVAGASDADDGSQHAFIYSKGRMRDLNDLVGQNSPWVLQTATGINDAGQIAVTGKDSSSVSHGFVLTPNPTDRKDLHLCSAGD